MENVQPRDYYLIQQLARAINQSEKQVAEWFVNLDIAAIKNNIQSGLYRSSTADTAVY